MIMASVPWSRRGLSRISLVTHRFGCLTMTSMTPMTQSVASLYKKVISGRPYWYLREMGWVDGKPKMVSERYLGSAAEIEALLDAWEQAIVPDRIRHLDFGAVAAVWGLLSDLGVTAAVSYTHLRAHETPEHLVCRLL